MGKKFLRSETVRHLRLGKNRRKLQKWRKSRGRHSKFRRNRAGYPSSPTVGYKRQRSIAGLIKGKRPIVVINMNELERADKMGRIVISRRVGAKNRIELLRKAREMNFEISGGKS